MTCNETLNRGSQLKLKAYLFKGILVIFDHDLASYEQQKIDERLHMAELQVPERSILGVGHFPSVQSQFSLL